MSIPIQNLRLPPTLALRWRALAERKVTHLAETYSSGRWKRYYTEEQMLAALRDAKRARDAWDRFIQHEQSSVRPYQPRRDYDKAA